jgi:ABC-type glycerol-3-phosphate transport system substrate-binding protein
MLAGVVLSVACMHAGKMTVSPVHAQGAITLDFWFWGESKVTGANKWMRETITLFEKAHPNIHVNLDVQGDDNLVSNFQAAAAHKGPDLATQWATVPVLEQARTGAAVPLDDYTPKSEIKHWASTAENVYNGKGWGMPLYLVGTPVVYNKILFRKAGLDPNKPPRTWAQFLEACAKLKASGIVPFAMGNKDGFAWARFWGTFGRGTLDSVDDIKRAVVGQTHLTDSRFTNWLAAMETMVKSGYFNNDIASLDLENGPLVFARGNAAMTH